MAKIDEQISYNWLFFLLASAFGAVTFWAVYDEAVTRREYKGYQETFFDIETKLAEKSWKDAKAKLEADPKYRSLIQEKQKVDEEVRGRAAEIKATEAEAMEAEFEAKDRIQNYTFTKSVLDEEYYNLTLAKHEISPETAKDSEAYHKLEKQQAKYNQLEKELKEAEKVANESNAKWEAIKQKLASFTARQKQLAKDIEDMERPIAELGRKYQASAEPSRRSVRTRHRDHPAESRGFGSCRPLRELPCGLESRRFREGVAGVFPFSPLSAYLVRPPPGREVWMHVLPRWSGASDDQVLRSRANRQPSLLREALLGVSALARSLHGGGVPSVPPGAGGSARQPQVRERRGVSSEFEVCATGARPQSCIPFERFDRGQARGRQVLRHA